MGYWTAWCPSAPMWNVGGRLPDGTRSGRCGRCVGGADPAIGLRKIQCRWHTLVPLFRTFVDLQGVQPCGVSAVIFAMPRTSTLRGAGAKR